MYQLLLHGMLLAAQNPLENLTREFQGRETRTNSGYLTTGLLILLAMLVAVWLLSQVVERYGSRRPTDSPLRLFLALCWAHRLRWKEGWLLWRVARDQQLADPARLFLEPSRIDPANVSPVLGLRAAELDAIGRRLFANAPEDAPPRSPQAAESEKPPSSLREAETPTWSPIPGLPGATADLSDLSDLAASLRPRNHPPTTSR